MVRYRTAHGIRNFYVNVIGWSGSLLALFAVTTPPGEFGAQFLPIASVITVVAVCVAVRARWLGVDVTPDGLLVHGFWRSSKLTGDLRTSIRTVRPGKSWMIVTDGVRTARLPLIANIANPVYPALKLYPENMLESRMVGQGRWESTNVAWGTQLMFDRLGVTNPESSGAVSSRPPVSFANSLVVTFLSVTSMTSLVAYTATRSWPLLVASVALMTFAAIILVRSRQR